MNMKITARDIMSTSFHTLSPETPVQEAITLFKQASRKEERKLFGLMVLSDGGKLAGMLSMYDILLYMRPKHIHIWGMMEDIDVAGLVDAACSKMANVLVGDIMSCEVITISPDTHKFMILDIMIKKHIRRLPVIDEGVLVGIVYISDLFYDILDRFTEGG
jgi:CBS domain-containing protein